MTLKHTAIQKYKPLLKEFYKIFLAGGKTLSMKRWTSNTVDMAKAYFPNDSDAQNKFKGDHLEILAEYWFNSFGPDPSVGLVDYEPADASWDFGVDGKGRNANGDTSVVQVKFRSNPKDVITYADLARTYADGIDNHGLVPKNPSTLWLITNAENVSSQAIKFFGDTLHVITLPAMRHKVNNNLEFWKGFAKLF